MASTNGTETKRPKRLKIGRALTVTLPSGYKVRARRPALQAIIATGDIPSDLTAMVANAEGGKLNLKDLSMPEIAKGIRFSYAYLKHVLVDPKLDLDAEESDVTEDADGYLHGRIIPMDLPDEDQNFLWGFAHGMILVDEETQEVQVSPLPAFRDGEVGDHAGPAGAEVPPTPLADSGPVVG